LLGMAGQVGGKYEGLRASSDLTVAVYEDLCEVADGESQDG
jgi:hypothetical protein